MREVLFFPDNKVGVSVEPFFNGHIAAVSNNTDTLRVDRYAMAEIGLMRNNLQGTAYVSFGDPAGLVRDLQKTGRVSFGLYYLTDQWVNPVTGIRQGIPDYNSSTWTADGVSAFSGATLGAPKPSRSPNHGQQMYDVSGGAYGYDFESQTFGASGASETYELSRLQVEHLRGSFNIPSVSSLSYRNGQTGAALLLMKDFVGGRNSDYSFSGDSVVSYGADITHPELISRASSTRTLDAGNSNFPSHADSILYTRSQVQLAIDTGGWWNDFVHWHNAYRDDQLWFFEEFYSAVDDQIGGQDVWRAGQNEVNDYFIIRESIDKVGSFFEGQALRIFVRFRDAFSGGSFAGVSESTPQIPASTGLSLRLNLSGTPLSGHNITCNKALSIRKMGNDEWVVNFKIGDLVDAYRGLSITSGGSEGSYYNPARPALSYSAGQVSADQPCKFVVWRSQGGAGHEAVYRSAEFEESVLVAVENGYDVTVGAITRSRVSSAIDI